MRRRSSAGGEPVKARRRKAATLKRGNAPKAVRRRGPSSATLQEQLDRRTRELHEALEQQAATARVLQVISSSTFDLQTVLDTLVESAARLCRADSANISRVAGDNLRVVAYSHMPLEYREFMMNLSLNIDRGSLSGRSVLEGKIVHVPDVLADPEFTMFESQKRGGYRTGLAIPLVCEGTPIGVFFLMRPTIDPFTLQQIELVQNFGAQAVIAIENTRQLNELRQRTADLTEALEQQTATSEVLQVISSSPGDLQPVFATMLGNAARICDAKFGNIFRWDGDVFSLVATHNTPPAFAEYRKRRPLPLKPNLPFSRMVVTNAVVHCADAAALPAYTEQRDPDIVAAVELAGIRTFVAVPMLKENKLIGALIVYRQEVHPFTDKQIELVKNFAAQAVIAIENARLLSELRQRTTDLTESLEQQTATSEVLRVISSSPGELERVFNAVLANATRICDAKFGVLQLCDGDAFRAGAWHNAPPTFADFIRRGPIRPGPNVPLSRMARSKQVVHVADITMEQAYIERDPVAVAGAELGGYRTVLAVPQSRSSTSAGMTPRPI
jgi:GAF domain-containing protein